MATLRVGYVEGDNRSVTKNFTEIERTEHFQKKLPYDWENPTITIKKVNNYEQLNYALIDDIKYFVTKKVELQGGLIELTLHCDYLINAWDTIKEQTFLVERQENKRNKMLIDNEFILQSNENFVCKQFGASVNASDNYVIYLTTNGGVS